MKTLIRTFYTITIFAVLNSACRTIASEGTTSTASSSGTPIVTLLRPTMSANATTVLLSNFDFSCWPIKPLEQGNASNGSILYASFPYESSEQYANGFFAWDINTFQSTPVKFAPHQLKTGEVYHSPDGKLVALISENSLLLVSKDGTQSFRLPVEYLKIRTYLPDGRILLDLLNSHLSDFYVEGKGFTDIYYVFDPTTGEATNHSVFLPNFAPGEDLWTLQYSPDLKYILYRSSPGENNIQFTLFDLEKNEVVWVGPSRDSSLVNVAIPAWRPDSSALTAIYIDGTGYRNYYSISLDGKVSTMNSFNGADLDGVTGSDLWWNLDLTEFANWSPNGQYLASTGYPNGVYKDLPSLFIWDDQEKMLYKPCLPNEGARIVVPLSITWSFDRLHALVSLTFLRTATPVEIVPGVLSPDYYSKDYVLDLVHRIIYEIPDDNKGNFVTYKAGYNTFLGWVNWEIP